MAAIGVVIPVHGEAPWLGESIAAVLAQEPTPLEVVVVDDGSPQPLAAAGGVRLVRLDVQAGPAAAREAGLAALGDVDVVALADADDVWEPGFLAALVGALGRFPSADVAFGRPSIVGPHGRPTGEVWDSYPAGLLEPERFGALLFERCLIPMPGAVVRRSALEAAGGFDGGPPLAAATDWELWLRLVGHGSAFVFEPEAVVRVRRHEGAHTRDIARLAESIMAVHEAHAGLAPEEVRRVVRSRDRVALARGRVRQRRYAEARQLLTEAGEGGRLGLRERLLRSLLVVPGVRELLGRRDPYRSPFRG
jgi:glycosyltransferase involved in cell wall biosynthesis